MSDPHSGTPFRDAPPKQPRYLCTVCYKTATTVEAGVCPCSGAPRQALDNAEVTELVRARAAARMRRRSGLLTGFSLVSALLISFGVCDAFGLQMNTDRGALHGSGSWFAGIAFALFVVFIMLVKLIEKAPPTETPALISWLGVKVEP